MNPFDILKNASQIKEQVAKLKDEISSMTTTGSSGGNMVRVTINGQFELKDIQLDPICVDNRDVKMLQDLIVAAHKNAMDKMQELIKEKAGPMLGGGLGGLGL